MASELKTNNARSPRFSTNKALGFRGGSIGAGGNIQDPTFQEVEGARTASPAAAPDRPQEPAISQFSAMPQPKGTSIAATLGAGALSAVGGEAIKTGLGAIKDKLTAPSIDTTKGMPPVQGFGDEPALDAGMTAADVAPMDFIDNGMTAADVASFDGLDAAADGVTGGVPILGPAIRLAQGDVGGAAGSAIGGAIGSTIFPGVGTAIGSFIGGALGGGCFITEAVMSAGGQGDTAPELESLRQFRDQVLSTTPQGQALIQEYESIAPMVVEAVVQRPDALQIFQQIDAQFINPAVEAVNAGDFSKALQIYAQMISFVTPFATEGSENMPTMPGQGGQQQAMDQMGQHAAMVGHMPEIAGAATGDMGMMDDDPDGYDGGPQGAPLGGPGGGGMAGMAQRGAVPMGANPMMQQFAKPRY